MTDLAAERAYATLLHEALGGACEGIAFANGEAEVQVPRARLLEAMKILRDAPTLAFAQVMDVCAIDWPGREVRFDVAYHLLSLKYNRRLRVLIQTDELTPVPSVTALYPAAGWFEREVFDMFGLSFSCHPDLRRILTDYDFDGFPLRRDFPLTGFTQVRYDDLQRRVVQEPVSLQQDYRAADNASPWRGMTDVQKRGEK